MLKWARRIFVFLLLGAVVNVALAWGCVFANGDVSRRDHLYRLSSDPDYFRVVSVTRRAGFSYLVESVPWRSSPKVRELLPFYPGTHWWRHWPMYQVQGHGHIGCGWPMHTFGATLIPDPDVAVVMASLSISPRLRGGLASDEKKVTNPRTGKIPMILPYLPLWRGFVTNSLFYAGLVGGAHALRAQWLRDRRVKRIQAGRCPACNHPRGTPPVCTECGEALPC